MSAGADFEQKKWVTLDRRQLVDAAPWLQVWVEKVQLPDGRVIDDYYAVEQPDFVVIFAITSSLQVLTIWHYKHGPRRVNLGLPAGYVSPSETTLAAAQRELREETGYEADSWQHLGTFSVDGNHGAGQAHIYLARELREVCDAYPDDLEEIKLDLVTLSELQEHLQAGRVATLGAAAAIAFGLNTITHSARG